MYYWPNIGIIKLLSFPQEFPFYVFWPSATTVHPLVAMLRRQNTGHHAQRTGGSAELLAPSYAHAAQYHAGARLADVGGGSGTRKTFTLNLPVYRTGAPATARGRSAGAGSHRSTGATGRRQNGRAADAGFPSGPQLPSGPSHPARTLLSSHAKSAARQRTASLRNPHCPPNLQRPDPRK